MQDNEDRCYETGSLAKYGLHVSPSRARYMNDSWRHKHIGLGKNLVPFAAREVVEQKENLFIDHPIK